MSEEKKENVPEIRKISDNVYINVSKIKSENVDLDGNDGIEKSPEEKSDSDRSQGDETIGIP